MKIPNCIYILVYIIIYSSFYFVHPAKAGCIYNDTTTISKRPSFVNNALSPYFPAVFNQDGGSCGSASRIGYMFTHEINAFRGADASDPENIYPTHFTWLLTNSNSGKEVMAKANGIPNMVEYGGATYSRVFGNQDCADPDFGWMQGYDKWYRAMFNRISRNSFSPYGVDSEKGREFVKNWLWNHQGDSDFRIGGICGIGVASACRQASIDDDPQGINKSAGVVGQKYVTRWGDGVDHALTIVGYDDRIVFDLDSNKVYGEKDKDECGAWIIVNSWGDGWANNGFIYCPYKYGFPVRQNEGGAWKPEFYHVRKNYRPLRTLKVRMDYSHRSEIKLVAGISTDLNATEPDISVELEHFKFAGDGRSSNAKNGKEAPTPMLGKWADGKLHSEPMEFGYDLTDLSSGFDTRQPLKYFFNIERKEGSSGSGNIYLCSVIDYEFDEKGIETPLIASAVSVKDNNTSVSSVIYGEPFFKPLNFRCINNKKILEWSKPQLSHYPLDGYIIYKDNQPLDTLPSGTNKYVYTEDDGCYSVSALYKFNDKRYLSSSRTYDICPSLQCTNTSEVIKMNSARFVIPEIFSIKHDCVTIEYWMKPYSWRNWNQSVGSGWGKFLAHANDKGVLSVGWDTENRIDTEEGCVFINRWQHFAYVVNKDTMSVYIDGKKVGQHISKNRFGIGGFGDFYFGIDSHGAMDCELAEVRIWDVALDSTHISDNMYSTFNYMSLPENMLAYYKGGLFKTKDKDILRDFTMNNNAELLKEGNYEIVDGFLKDHNSNNVNKLDIDFSVPDTMFVGRPYKIVPKISCGLLSMKWNASKSNVKNVEVKYPSFVFDKAGKRKISLYAEGVNGEKTRVSHTVRVMPVPRADASFKAVRNEILAGERISFTPLNPVPGYNYEWTMKGGDTEKAFTQNAATTYEKSGEYEVKLCVKRPYGNDVSEYSKKIYVRNVAPEVSFEVSPMIIRKGDWVTLKDKSRYMPSEWNWTIESRRFTTATYGQNARLRMMHSGVYDVTLKATNEEGSNSLTRNGVLIVCNADSKNGLNFSSPVAKLQTIRPLWQGTTEQLTVEWWMNPSSKGDVGGIGHSPETWRLTADKNGRMTFYVDSIPVRSNNGFVIGGQWHHYAVTFNQGRVEFMRDGELLYTSEVKTKDKKTIKVIPEIPYMCIGGENMPMHAVIDELRIWNKSLSEASVRKYCNSPLENIHQLEQEEGLVLYYSFNQNGGDVNDLTSNNNSGIRKSFGPDGDAWGKSSGVFSLNFDTPFEDLTDKFLPHSSQPFLTDGSTVNCNDTLRFLRFDNERSGWTVKGFVDNDSIITGVHVDRNKDNALCVYTGWDGFAKKIFNHKIYRTLRLPAGKYELEIIPMKGYGYSVGASRLVVVEGIEIPDLDSMDNAINSVSLSELKLPFILDSEKEISLGVVFDLQGRSGIAIQKILLHKSVYTKE